MPVWASESGALQALLALQAVSGRPPSLPAPPSALGGPQLLWAEEETPPRSQRPRAEADRQRQVVRRHGVGSAPIPCTPEAAAELVVSARSRLGAWRMRMDLRGPAKLFQRGSDLTVRVTPGPGGIWDRLGVQTPPLPPGGLPDFSEPHSPDLGVLLGEGT